MRVKDISFLKTVFLDPHNHQGIGNLIQVEIHHIQIILVNRSIDHVYRLCTKKEKKFFIMETYSNFEYRKKDVKKHTYRKFLAGPLIPAELAEIKRSRGI